MKNYLVLLFLLMVSSQVRAMEVEPLLRGDELHNFSEGDNDEVNLGFTRLKNVQKVGWFKRRKLLIKASINGDIATVQQLLERGTNRHIVDSWDYGNTPLHLAAQEGHTEIVQLLLENDDTEKSGCLKASKIRSINRDRYTPLHLAAKNGHTYTVAVLLDHIPTDWINYTTYSGKSAFDLVVTADHTDIVRIMLEKVRDHIPDSCLARSLLCAAQNGNVTIVKLLLEAGVTSNTRDLRHGWTALHFAAYNGHEELIPLLMSKGTDPCTQSRHSFSTALHFAVKKKYISLCKALLQGVATQAVQSLHTCIEELQKQDIAYEKKQLINEARIRCKEKFLTLCQLLDQRGLTAGAYASDDLTIQLHPGDKPILLKTLLQSSVATLYGALLIEKWFDEELNSFKGKDEINDE